MTTKVNDTNIINFIENIYYKIADKFLPTLKKYNIIPNHITILGIFTGLLSCYYLYEGKLLYSFIFLIISTFLDCLDGHYARKYNMGSKLGHYLDHLGDIFKFIVLLYVLYHKYYYEIYDIRHIILILIILNLIHDNCTYLYINKKEQYGINTKLCIFPEKYRKNIMYITANFTNTSILIIIYLYIFYKVKYN
jgi:phosphatidylglycerophosphate synthase